MKAPCLTFLLLLAALTAFAAEPKKKTAKYEPQPWGTWVEADFPFFSSVLDVRRDGLGKNNLTPRGLIIKLPNDCWACFDTDLLRVSAVWRGKGVSDKALAPSSGLATRSSRGGSWAPRSTAMTLARPPLRRKKSAAVPCRPRSAGFNPWNSSARTSS